MGFSGGGSNILKPHKHSSAAQDGSPLNMVNVTEGSLNAGDIIFSDGAALQRLAIGTPAQLIAVNAGATAPEYVTAGSSNAQTVFTAKTDGAFETSSTSFVAITGATHTIPNITSGKCMNNFNGGVAAGTGASGLAFQIWDDDTGAQMSVLKLDPCCVGYAQSYTVQGINDADGQTVYCNFKQDGGANSTLYASATAVMTLTAFAM